MSKKKTVERLVVLTAAGGSDFDTFDSYSDAEKYITSLIEISGYELDDIEVYRLGEKLRIELKTKIVNTKIINRS